MSSAVYAAPTDDHYATLGVSRFAASGDIKRAYKTLALKLHPDKNPDGSTHRQFQSITDAYSVLNDSGSKKSYDIKLYASQAAAKHPIHSNNSSSSSSSSSFGSSKVRPESATRAASGGGVNGSNMFGTPRNGSSTGGFRPAAPRTPTNATNASSNPSANPTTPPSVNIPVPKRCSSTISSTFSGSTFSALPTCSTPRGDSSASIQKDRDAAMKDRQARVSGYTLSSVEVDQLNQMRARDSNANATGGGSRSTTAADYDRFLREGQVKFTHHKAKHQFNTHSSSATPPTTPRTPSGRQELPSTSFNSTATTTGSDGKVAHSNSNKSVTSPQASSFVTEATVSSVLEAIRVQREELEQADQETKVRLNVSEDVKDAPRPLSFRPQSATTRRPMASTQYHAPLQHQLHQTLPMPTTASPTIGTSKTQAATRSKEGDQNQQPTPASASHPETPNLCDRPRSSFSSGIWNRNLKAGGCGVSSSAELYQRQPTSSTTIGQPSHHGVARPQTAKARMSDRVPEVVTPPPQPEKTEAESVVTTTMAGAQKSNSDLLTESHALPVVNKHDGGEAESSSFNSATTEKPMVQAVRGSASNAAAEARRAYQKSLFAAGMPVPLSSRSVSSSGGVSVITVARPLHSKAGGALNSSVASGGSTAPPTGGDPVSNTLSVPSDQAIGELETEALRRLLDDLDRKTKLARQELLLRSIS